MRTNLRKLAIVGVSLIAGLNLTATPLIDFTSPTVNLNNNNNWTLGYAFHVNSPIFINGLSIYDENKDGLAVAHAAGLWTSGGTLLASTIIPAGTVAPLESWFRVQAITAVLLPVGDYVVGARTEGENYTWDPTGFTTVPQITYQGNRYISSGGLAFPNETETDIGVGFFGGNASFAAASVPDGGSSLVLLGMAVVGLAGIGRFRK